MAEPPPAPQRRFLRSRSSKPPSERWILRRCITLLNYEPGILLIFLLPLLLLWLLEITMGTRIAAVLGPYISFVGGGPNPLVFFVLLLLLCALWVPAIGAVIWKVEAYPRGGISIRDALEKATRAPVAGPLFLHTFLFTLLGNRLLILILAVGASISGVVAGDTIEASRPFRVATQVVGIGVATWVASRLCLMAPAAVLEKKAIGARTAALLALLAVLLMNVDFILIAQVFALLGGAELIDPVAVAAYLQLPGVQIPPGDPRQQLLALMNTVSLLLIAVVTLVGYWMAFRFLHGFRRSWEMTRGRTRPILLWAGVLLYTGWFLGLGNVLLGTYLVPILTAPLFYMASAITYFELRAQAPAPADG